MKKGEWLERQRLRPLAKLLHRILNRRQTHLFLSACLRRVWALLPHDLYREAIEINDLYIDDPFFYVSELLEIWSAAELEFYEGLWVNPHPAWYDYWWYDDWYAWCYGEELEDGIAAEEEAIATHGFLDGVKWAVQRPSYSAAKAALYAQSLAVWAAKPDQRETSRAKERNAQYVILEDMGIASENGTPAATPSSPHFEDPALLQIASHIHTANRFDKMPILADALEEAGCRDDNVLSHCRGNAPHYRGCWVVERILGNG